MILLSLLAGFGIAQDDLLRLRTILPNGAAVLVERIPDAKTVSIQLFLSSRGTEESANTNGYRHLLEHLIATGSDGNLDTRLETQGLELVPRTLRDAMVFEVDAPTDRWEMAVKAFAELAKPRPLSQEAIDREVGIIRQEGIFRPATSRLGEAAWGKAYGDGGGDPFGSPDVMKLTRPEKLIALQKITFSSNNAALVIAGDVDLDAATAVGKKLLELWPESKLSTRKPRQPVAGGLVRADAQGFAIGIPVGSYREPSTAAELAVALYLASQVEAGFVTYTPSSQNGMIVVGCREQEKMEAAISDLDPAVAYNSGKPLATQWVRQQLTGAKNIAFWRGLLLIQERDLRPETLLENLDTLKLKSIEVAVDALRSDRVVRVIGASQ